MSWLPKNKVVVPIDFSEESIAAAGLARDLVADSTHVHVIHVLPDLTATTPGVLWDTVDAAARRQNAAEAVERALAKHDLADAFVEIEFGDPGHRVAEFAKKIGADLVVMPSHGRTGLRHLLIGSVAERVVRLSHCPVLVLRS